MIWNCLGLTKGVCDVGEIVTIFVVVVVAVVVLGIANSWGQSITEDWKEIFGADDENDG